MDVKKFIRGDFMSTPIIVIIAIFVAIGALFITKQANSPVEEAAEEVIDYELGLPPGTINLSKDLKK